MKHQEDYSLFREAMARLTKGLACTRCLYTYFGDVAGLAADFFQLPFQVFGLDFVGGTGNWEAVKAFPANRALAMGIVDARNTKLETVEWLVEAVRRVRPVVPLSRLYLNPSCGLDFLPREVAHQKLVRLVEGARKAQEVLS